MTAWRTSKSEVKGGGRAHHGSIFTALVPIACDGCGRMMQPGEEFTRGNQGRGTVRDVRSHCWGTHRICCHECGTRERAQRTEGGEPDVREPGLAHQ